VSKLPVSTIKTPEIPGKERFEEEIRLHLRTRQVLLRVSTHFLMPEDFKNAIKNTLEDIGRLTGAKHTYLVQRSCHSKESKIYEWCAPGLKLNYSKLKTACADPLPWFCQKLMGGDYVYVENIAELPDEAKGEKKTLLAQGVSNLLAFPVNPGMEQSGYIRLDNIVVPEHNHPQDVDVLWVIAQIIGKALSQKRTEEALHAEHANLLQKVDERTVELREANAELLRAVKIKDEFLANMSHELRSPLHTILNTTEVLEDNLYGALSEKQKKAVQNIGESGQHLLALINDILDLSKLEAGILKIDAYPISIRETCNASIRLIREQAIRKGVRVSDQIDNQMTNLFTDERRLKQMLINLLTNAVKFTPEGGKIGLRVKGYPEKKQVAFTVWDTGIGISPDDLPRLFKPFVQLESGPGRKYSGTGLGLFLVKRLAEMLDGDVAVESSPGRGSQFTFWLPWEPERQQSIHLQDEAILKPSFSEHHQQDLILVVEDNKIARDTITDYLQLKGFLVVEACNGQEAIDFVQKNKPGYILMDIQLPGVDGLEAIRRIHSEAGTKNIYITALTAQASSDERERCLSAGAREYLVKPISLQKILNSIGTFQRGMR
jgi:signal transduction histidine kinase/ActR/RegA family two-component response regulator